MRKGILLLFVLAGLFLVGRWVWLRSSSPLAIAERLTGLDLPADALVVSFRNDRSVPIGGGITCGELSVSHQQVRELLRQAEAAGYVSNRSAGQPNLLAVMKQEGCCQNPDIQFGTVPGRYKLMKESKSESAYALIDSLHRSVYFFRAISQ